ncbi:hypothetical protein ACOSP7_011756 [Xanthoceras sorbifolium]
MGIESSLYLSVTSAGLFAFYKSTTPRMHLYYTVYGMKESEQPRYIRSVNGTLALYLLSAEPYVHYFNYVDPDAADLKGIPMESCKQTCLRNCSKAALFRFYFNITGGNCFLPFQVLSLANEGEETKVHRSYSYTEGGIEDYLEQLSRMPMRFSYEELKLATQNFHKRLGEGGFGSVFEVKRLDGLGQGKKEFLAEVKTLGSIHHVNLVRLIGFCAENLHRLLVYEFMCNGSLDKWIIGKQIVHEDCRQRIVHLDIKPQNIPLDRNLRANISDFGLSKFIVTEKVDDYSFGIVVMEVVCGRKNLDRLQSEECMHLLPFFMKNVEERLVDLVDKYNEDMQLH